MTAPSSEQGFSLIEALVAMLVLAIAAAGLVRAAEAHIDSIRAAERRATAQLIAQNRLVEIAIGDRSSGQQVAMLGEQWRVITRETAISDADMHKVSVSVFGTNDKSALITLDGFRDLGSTTR